MHGHWKPGVVMVPSLSSLVAPEIVITTTSSVNFDEKVSIMTTLRFHWQLSTIIQNGRKSTSSVSLKKTIFQNCLQFSPNWNGCFMPFWPVRPVNLLDPGTKMSSKWQHLVFSVHMVPPSSPPGYNTRGHARCLLGAQGPSVVLHCKRDGPERWLDAQTIRDRAAVALLAAGLQAAGYAGRERAAGSCKLCHRTLLTSDPIDRRRAILNNIQCRLVAADCKLSNPHYFVMLAGPHFSFHHDTENRELSWCQHFLSSLAASDVVIATTRVAASDDNFVITTTLGFQWMRCISPREQHCRPIIEENH